LTEDERAAVDRVVKRYNDHEVAYKQCVELTAKSKQQLGDIERLNAELAKLGQRIGSLTTQIQGLSVPPMQANPTHGTLDRKAPERATLLREQCEKIMAWRRMHFGQRSNLVLIPVFCLRHSTLTSLVLTTSKAGGQGAQSLPHCWLCDRPASKVARTGRRV